MAGREGELLSVEHVKYRNSEAGKSPIGTLLIFCEHIEWRDCSTPARTKIQFRDIKGQRVSPPHKPKVQLQICLQNEDQATFVFLGQGAEREVLVKERDTVKETLQQALIAHRQRLQQLTQTAEKSSKNAELETKQKILQQSKQLEELYKHLVTTKLITPQDFWKDYYKNGDESEERQGMTGAFLANIASSDTDGLKLNLNTNIINNIFATYPMVERKHLELVPHEMTEEQFWVKFATSHYFHRDREVLPNPDDPFADCVKYDEAEMSKIIGPGPKRKRLDFGYLDDNTVGENLNSKSELSSKASKATLIRRCNYLSERILSTQLVSSSTSTPSNGTSAPAINGTVPPVENGNAANEKKGGYSTLHRGIGDDDSWMELESAELGEDSVQSQLYSLKMHQSHKIAVTDLPADEAIRYKETVLRFLDDIVNEDILVVDDEWLCEASSSNGSSFHQKSRVHSLDPSSQWGKLSPYLEDIKVVHDAVAELAKHFWTCFPPTTPELEAKIERMENTLKGYEGTTLLEAEHRFGAEAMEHCREMINLAHKRYQAYTERRRK